MKKLRNSQNYNYKDFPGVTNTGISLTEPDQALSIREILTRYAHGAPLTIEKEGTYDSDNDTMEETLGIHPASLDLTDIERIKEETADTIDRFRREKATAQAKQAKAKTEAEIRAKIALENKETSSGKSKIEES